jgi:diacylglycerol kinase (ATP)
MDGEAWGGRGLFVAVANGTSYGAGARIAPDAKMDDGWLDVVVVGDVKFLRLLEALPRLFTSGDLGRFPEVQRFRSKQVKVSVSPAARVHGDGEELGVSPAEFEALPGAVKVVVPSPSN